MRVALFGIGTQLLGARAATHAARPDGRAHEFALAPRNFLLDGKPFQIRAGELHPVRIPRAYWRHRIRMVRAMGMNTVSVYLMWNTIETQPDVFTFADRSDIRAFLELCQAEGMWVYLRPGPYVCAEWDNGGLPAWLLNSGSIRLRTTDPAFMAPAARYIATIARLLRPFMVPNAGPVLMVQVENEYASFAHDRIYLEAIADLWRAHGIAGPFSIADGLPQLRQAGTTLANTAVGLDGETSVPAAVPPGGPVWISEAYPGWLTHWGDKHMASVDFDADFRTILQNGCSFSLYVAHGGTNFGLGAGANAGHAGTRFQPVVTSYDYDAPIAEDGRPRAKFHTMRRAVARATGIAPTPIPAAPGASGFAPVMARPCGDPRALLDPAIYVDTPRPIEGTLDQTLGIVVYATTLPPGPAAILDLGEVRDIARVLLGGTDCGTVSRVWREGDPDRPDTRVSLAARTVPTALEILVDTFGHVGYGPALGDRKGLPGPVTLGGAPITGWTMRGLDVAAPDCAARMRALRPTEPRPGPVVFRARAMRHTAQDCFLDLAGWSRGYVWVNGHLLGRYWSIGPQRRLFCPASWWRAGVNEIALLDWDRQRSDTITGFATAEPDA